MSQAQFTRGGASPQTGGQTFDADLKFLSRWSGPLGLLARALLAYIFIVEGIGKVWGYTGVPNICRPMVWTDVCYRSSF